MAIEYKYGKVTLERGSIGEDEPVVVFRAQDATLPDLLNDYEAICKEWGSPQAHIDRIRDTRQRIVLWQADGANRIKVPD